MANRYERSATYDDLYEILDTSAWKTAAELQRELENKRLDPRDIRGFMYIKLAKWEDDGFVRSRVRKKEGTNFFGRIEESIKKARNIPSCFLPAHLHP